MTRSTVLDMPSMVRLHGTLNTLGSAVPAVTAMTLEAWRAAVVRGPATKMRQGRAVR